MALVAPSAALASYPGSDPDPARDSPSKPPDPKPKPPDPKPKPPDPKPTNPDPDPGSDPGGDAPVPVGGVRPVGGVQTGAGGTAEEGPGALALALAGGSLVLAAAVGFALRRRTD
jgi:hypothetical protein